MRELGLNAALLYAAFLEQYSSSTGGKDLTLRMVFEGLAGDAHLSLHDLISAAETLERAGFINKKDDEIAVYVAEKGKEDNADE